MGRVRRSGRAPADITEHAGGLPPRLTAQQSAIERDRAIGEAAQALTRLLNVVTEQLKEEAS